MTSEVEAAVRELMDRGIITQTDLEVARVRASGMVINGGEEALSLALSLTLNMNPPFDKVPWTLNEVLNKLGYEVVQRKAG